MADSGGRRGLGGRPQDLLEAPAAWVGTKLQGVIKVKTRRPQKLLPSSCRMKDRLIYM